MTEVIQLLTHDSEQAQTLIEDLVAVYLEIHATPPTPFQNKERYRQQLAGHTTNPGWKLVTATEGDELVGYAYGFTLPATSRWWQGLTSPAPEGFTHEDGRRTFGISEIMVRAPWRRRGIARSLHHELLSGRTETRVTLLVEPGNLPARSVYARWGYHKVGQLRPAWEHAPLFDVNVLILANTESAARPQNIK